MHGIRSDHSKYLKIEKKNDQHGPFNALNGPFGPWNGPFKIVSDGNVFLKDCFDPQKV